MSEHVILKYLAPKPTNPYAYFVKVKVLLDPSENLTIEDFVTRELEFQRFLGAADAQLANSKEGRYFQTWAEVAQEVYKKNLEVLYVPALLYFVGQSSRLISGWAPDLTGTPLDGRAFNELNNFKFA